MIGDGHQDVRHCEYADVPMDMEPDAGPVYCETIATPDPDVREDVWSVARHTIDPIVADLARPCLETDRACLDDLDGLLTSVNATESWATRAIRMLRKAVTYVVCQ